MFCTQCGSKLPEGSIFCTQCGNKIGENEIDGHKVSKPSKPPTSNEPTLVVKPSFTTIPSLVNGLFASVFLAFLAGIPLASILFWVNGFFQLKLFQQSFSFSNIIGVVVALFLISIVVMFFMKKRTYDKTEYRFFDNRLEYTEGFLDSEAHSIKYNQITNTAVKRSMVQQVYGLGTISLWTASKVGITIQDVANVDKIYETIKKFVDQ